MKRAAPIPKEGRKWQQRSHRCCTHHPVVRQLFRPDTSNGVNLASSPIGTTP